LFECLNREAKFNYLAISLIIPPLVDQFIIPFELVIIWSLDESVLFVNELLTGLRSCYDVVLIVAAVPPPLLILLIEKFDFGLSFLGSPL
jgi:hypothetical protein